MSERFRFLAVFGGARLSLLAIIAMFLLAALAFAWFGFVPASSNPSTGETTYRVIGPSFQLDGAIARALGVSMLTARYASHIVIVMLCLLGAWFFRQMDCIVRSAQEGDPFTLANAARLSLMGWILLSPALLAVLVQLARLAPPDAGQVLNWVLASAFGFVLLVLAGVFRHGAAMRDDLAGTV